MTNRGGTFVFASGYLRALRCAVDWWDSYAPGESSVEFLEFIDLCLAGDGCGEFGGEFWKVERSRSPWKCRCVHMVSGLEFVCNAKGAYVTARGGVCTRYGGMGAYTLAEGLLAAVGSYRFMPTLTRVDVAVDILGWSPVMPMYFRVNGGARPTFHGVDVVDSTFQTVEVGSRGKDGAGCQVVIYDKSREMVANKHDADYSDMLRGDWSLNGWESHDRVWRCEVRLWRPKLDVSQLSARQCLESPWLVVAVGVEWSNLRDESGAEHPVWSWLRAQCDVPASCKRSARLRRVPSEESLVAQSMRLAARYQAVHGLAGLEESFERLMYGCLARMRDVDYPALVASYTRDYGRLGSVLMESEPF